MNSLELKQMKLENICSNSVLMDIAEKNYIIFPKIKNSLKNQPKNYMHRKRLQ